MKTQLIMAAAGLGKRFGADIPKALVELAGKPLLAHTLEQFRPCGLLENAIILVSPGYEPVFQEVLAEHFSDNSFCIVSGGQERIHSVSNGLAQLLPDTEIVVIHDAARLFITASIIEASIEAASHYGAATVAVPSVDTILVGDSEGFLTDTPDRSCLWACQTPQTFRVAVIREAHELAFREGFLGTDDATLVRRLGNWVKLVPGHRLNFKVTTPEDRILAETMLRQGDMA